MNDTRPDQTPSLDEQVAIAQGWENISGAWFDKSGKLVGRAPASAYRPSTDWLWGGPVIAQHHIMLVPDMAQGQFKGSWRAVCFIAPSGRVECSSDTPLKAAMEAFVRSAALRGSLPPT